MELNLLELMKGELQSWKSKALLTFEMCKNKQRNDGFWKIQKFRFVGGSLSKNISGKGCLLSSPSRFSIVQIHSYVLIVIGVSSVLASLRNYWFNLILSVFKFDSLIQNLHNVEGMLCNNTAKQLYYNCNDKRLFSICILR